MNEIWRDNNEVTKWEFEDLRQGKILKGEVGKGWKFGRDKMISNVHASMIREVRISGSIYFRG